MTLTSFVEVVALSPDAEGSAATMLIGVARATQISAVVAVTTEIRRRPVRTFERSTFPSHACNARRAGIRLAMGRNKRSGTFFWR
jgi:hypothetical protein